jgi:hypothetical protein
VVKADQDENILYEAMCALRMLRTRKLAFKMLLRTWLDKNDPANATHAHISSLVDGGAPFEQVAAGCVVAGVGGKTTSMPSKGLDELADSWCECGKGSLRILQAKSGGKVKGGGVGRARGRGRGYGRVWAAGVGGRGGQVHALDLPALSSTSVSVRPRRSCTGGRV